LLRASIDVSIDVSAVPERPAGAGRYTVELVSALARRDDARLVLLARRGDEARWRRWAPGAELVVRTPRARPLRLAWEQLAMPALVDRLGVSVHHGPHYTMPERCRSPKVVTVHDMTFFDHPELHETAKVPVFRRAIRRAGQHASAIITPSEATAGRLAELISPACPVLVVPHGVDHDRFEPSDGLDSRREDDLALLASVGVVPPYVGFVGTIEPRKGVAGLVRAFDLICDRHPGLKLVLAGRPGWGAKELDAALAQLRHAERVVRTGYLSEAAVPALLRRAEVIAYPASVEGFGLPALEALACGAPLVTTAGTVMAEMAGGAALLVPPGDDRALAEALADALSGGAAVESRRAQGFVVAARHTWDASAEAHLAAYHAALDHAAGRR
jgi:glycosyltransferase involved in cell wall biosynthesis